MLRARALLVAAPLVTGVAACGGDEPSSTGAGAGDTGTVTRQAGPPPPGPPRENEPARLDPARFTTRTDNPWWPMVPGSRSVYVERHADGTVLRDEITVTRRTTVVAGGRARVVHERLTRGGDVVEDTFDWFAQNRAGEAEDAARSPSLGEQVQAPYGHFRHALPTAESTPLEPRQLEHEVHARGVGLVLAGVSGTSAREKLVRYREGGG